MNAARRTRNENRKPRLRFRGLVSFILSVRCNSASATLPCQCRPRQSGSRPAILALGPHSRDASCSRTSPFKQTNVLPRAALVTSDVVRVAANLDVKPMATGEAYLLDRFLNPRIPSISNTRGHRPGSAPPLVVILPSRNQRANCPSAKKLIGQVTTGRTGRAVAIAKYQPHGGKLRKGCDRLSARNSSITRAARDCESGESLGRKWGRVAAVTGTVRVAREWRTESATCNALVATRWHNWP